MMTQEVVRQVPVPQLQTVEKIVEVHRPRPLLIEVRVAFDIFPSFAATGMALEALARLC